MIFWQGRLSPNSPIWLDHLGYFSFSPIITNNVLLLYLIYWLCWFVWLVFWVIHGAGRLEGLRLNFIAGFPVAQSSHAGGYQTSYRVGLQHGNEWPYFPLSNLHFLLNSLDMEVSSATLPPGTQAWEFTLDFSLPTPHQPVTKLCSFYLLSLS